MRQLIVLLAVLTCCEHALAMGGGHGTKPVNLSDSHLSELANRPGRVGGYWVNSNDWFYFAGDTKALNDFLRRYAEMKGTPLVLVIHPGKAPAEACVGDLFAEPYDWKLDSMYRGFTRDKTWFQKPDGGQWPGSVVIVQAWLGGNVRLDDLEVPANIEVRPGGEIGEFIKEHNKKKAECSVRQKDVLLRGAAASCRHLCLDIDEDAKVEQIGGATSSRCLRLATGKAPDARWKLTETERGHLIQAQTGKLAGWYLDFDSKNRVDVELKITRVWLYAERPNHGAEGKTSGKEEPTLGVPGGVKITGPTAANAPGPLTIDLILAEGMREVPSIWIGYEQWYRWGGGGMWIGRTHSPCGQRGPFTFTLTRYWLKTSDKSLKMSDKAPLKLSPGKHTVRFAYEAHRRATGTPDTDPKGPLLLISNPVDIEILPAEEAAWGEPVEGVQCRLRAKKATWPLWDVRDFGKAPKFNVDVRSLATEAVFRGSLWGAGVHVQWDGKWHEPTGEMIIAGKLPPSFSVKPGDVLRDLDFNLETRSVMVSPDGVAENPWRITPTAGEHTVRIAIQLRSGERRISVVSNPVKIQAVPPGGETANAEPAWGEAIEGVQCRLRAKKVTWPLWDVRDFGKAPKFNVDIRSLAKEAAFRGSLWGPRVHVQWDGKWHEPKFLPRITGKLPPSFSVKPGDVLRDLDFNLETHSVAGSEEAGWENTWGIKPTTGEHTVRIAVQLHSGERRISVVSNPVTIEIVPSGGEAAKAAPPWGEPADGVQCRLRPDKVTWPLWDVGDLGKAPKFKVDVRSRSKQTYSGTHPSTGCGMHVEWDGKWYKPQWEQGTGEVWPVRPGDDWPNLEFSLDAGGVAGNADGTDQQNAWGIKPTVGWHTIRIAVQLFGETDISVVSNPVKIEIVAPGGETANAAPAWGEPVEGVQCRLEPEKARWTADEIPKLTAYVRDPGKSDLWLENPPEAGARLQIDGQWHRWGGEVQWIGPTHSPCSKRGSFALALSRDWRKWPDETQKMSAKAPLKLSPGKHTVRFAYEVFRRAPGARAADLKEPLLLISNPVEIEILPAEELPFGEPVEGGQCRLEPEKARWAAGEVPKLTAYVRDQGKSSLWLVNPPEAGARLQIDGQWYRWGGVVEWTGPPRSPCSRRGPFAFGLSRDWLKWSDETLKMSAKAPLRLSPGKHTVRFAYEAYHIPMGAPAVDPKEPLLLLISNPVEIEILPAEEPPWGEPVEGVQCRLEPEKTRWAADEVPKLTAYVRDRGKAGFWLPNPPAAGARLQIDGQWYRWGGGGFWTGPTHSPCDQRGPFAFTLTRWWQKMPDKSPLKLSPGKHSVRFAYEAHRRATGPPDTDPKGPLLLISNPVDIEILPAEEAAWGEPVEGVQCRLRAKKATWPLWDVRDFGKAPKFKVDIRSLAKEAVFRGSLWGYGVHVQWDGKWHKREWLGPVAGIAPPSLSVKPGDVLRDLQFNLETRHVMSSPDGVAENLWGIRPTTGEHTVRIAVQLRSGERRISVVSNPVTIEIVPSGGETTETVAVWGKATDGVQCRLRPEKVTWPLWNAGDLGKAPKFKVDIRSRSKKTYWGSLPSSGCGVHVEWDGKWHEPQWENYDDPPWMVGPGVDLPDQEFSLDAGGAMISPEGTAENTWGIKPTVGWHTIRIAIQLFGEARISVVSNPVKIFVVAPGGETANAAPAWGEPVEGVQCRLRPEKVAWPLWDVRDLGKAPKFKVDIRRAEQPFGYGMLVGNGVHVQWDGKWHNWQRARSPGKHLSVGPGNVLPGLRFSLGEGGLIGEPGRAAENVWGIKPTVGAHTVRIAIQLVDGRDLADGPPDISVVSNPVEIEIVAGEPGDAVFGPVIERPVTRDSSKAMRYLDLETGKYAAPQSDGVFATTGWLKKHGVDLQSGPYESGPTSRTAVDMMLRQLPDAVFGASHDWTADEARAKLNNLAGPQSVRVIGAPGIYAFRTREGSLGIMQLVAAPKNKSEVTVRYRLLKQPGHLTVGAERPADTFAVYLVDQRAPYSVLHGDISKLRLAKRPILTLEDVLAVDARGGIFLKEPARRLLFEGSGHDGEGSKPDSDLSPQELQQRRAIGRSGQRGTGHQDPFVLVLDGRRVQAGRIFCLVSSPMIRAIRYAPPGEPVMVCTAGEVDLEKDKKDKEAFLDVLRREGKVIEWGTAVRSVQCGLRADRVRWKANELPTLALGVRNLEPLIWKTHSLELELDGQWYQTTTDQALEPFPAPTSTKEFFHFRQEQDTQVCELRLLGDHWQRKDGTSGERSTMGKERPMRLTPGKHVVRVAVGARYHGGGRDEPLIRALSKPIEIEVVAEEAPGAADETAPDRRIIDGKTKIDETSWGKPVDGLQLGVSFVYGDRPYLAGERVDLKLTVRNNTTKTVELADFTPLVGWTPTISESDGKTKVFVNSPDVSFPVQTRRSKIAPGETWVVGGTSVILDPAPRFPAKQHNTTPRVKLAAGKYHISQTYRFGDLELTSGKLELTVVATKPADATEKYNADSRVTDTDSSESVPPPKFQPTISRTVSFDFFKNEAYFNRRCQVSIAAQFLGEDFLGCSVSSQFFTVF